MPSARSPPIHWEEQTNKQNPRCREWDFVGMRSSRLAERAHSLLGALCRWPLHPRARGTGGNQLPRALGGRRSCKHRPCLPSHLQKRPLSSRQDREPRCLWILSPHQWPCAGPQLAAHSDHRPHCMLNLKQTRCHAQQLVHKTLITVLLLERPLASEGVPHRGDGKTLMGLHAAGHAKGRGPGTCPSSAFPDRLPALAPRILVTSLEPRKEENPPGSSQFPPKALWPLGPSGKWLP